MNKAEPTLPDSRGFPTSDIEEFIPLDSGTRMSAYRVELNFSADVSRPCGRPKGQRLDVSFFSCRDAKSCVYIFDILRVLRLIIIISDSIIYVFKRTHVGFIKNTFIKKEEKRLDEISGY
jgi:hypothetical protein